MSEDISIIKAKEFDKFCNGPVIIGCDYDDVKDIISGEHRFYSKEFNVDGSTQDAVMWINGILSENANNGAFIFIDGCPSIKDFTVLAEVAHEIISNTKITYNGIEYDNPNTMRINVWIG